MLLSIAWKNIWRNKKRSLVVIVAVTLGIISGVLLVGIMEGWVRQRLKDAINNEVSHIQIHNTGYLRNEEIDLSVDNVDQISKSIDTLRQLKGRAARTKIIAMANTPWANTGLIVYGINPDDERKISDIPGKIVAGGGEYIDSRNQGSILISDKTAELLKLKQYIVTDSVISELRALRIPDPVLLKLETIKDRRFRSPKDFKEALGKELIRKELDRYGAGIMEKALDYRIRNKVQITISDLQGDPVQGIFRVCGIYKTTNTGYDQVSAFVNAPDLAALYGGNKILTHEIAIMLNDISDAGVVSDELGRLPGANTVDTWKELAPDAAMMNDFMIIYYFIFVGIIMLALAFGIINTMLMAVLERTKELGMLMAIGMNRKRVFSMIMLETIFLTLVGAVSGMGLGWGIATVLGNTGIRFTGWGEGFEAIGFSSVVYPVVTPGFIAFTAAMVIFTATVSSVWPARKALKLNPVEALRTD